ncbi:ATP-binding protein [Streptomyces sp. NPDC059631]|uniref:ATP-binding protein n=1 Tax=unclassified Streptomyces TaxID=2593676 RepID=UPI0036CF11A9
MHSAQTRSGCEFSFKATPAAVRAARHRISATVREWGVALDEDLSFRLELVASELLTNGALHAGGRLTAVVAMELDLLFVEVLDESAAAPRPRTAGPDDESGRGLTLVEALCLLHGSEPTAEGKRCWAVLPLRQSHIGADVPQGRDIAHGPFSAQGPDTAYGPDSARWSLTEEGARLLARLCPFEERDAPQVPLG